MVVLSRFPNKRDKYRRENMLSYFINIDTMAMAFGTRHVGGTRKWEKFSLIFPTHLADLLRRYSKIIRQQSVTQRDVDGGVFYPQRGYIFLISITCHSSRLSCLFWGAIVSFPFTPERRTLKIVGNSRLATRRHDAIVVPFCRLLSVCLFLSACFLFYS